LRRLPRAQIWVTVFASKFEDDYRTIVRNAQLRDPRIKFISGDIQTSYWGRFGHALFAHTPYVILYDDDSIPGRKAAEQLLHMLNIRTGEYLGVLGMKGRKQIMPIVNPKNGVSVAPSPLPQFG